MEVPFGKKHIKTIQFLHLATNQTSPLLQSKTCWTNREESLTLAVAMEKIHCIWLNRDLGILMLSICR